MKIMKDTTTKIRPKIDGELLNCWRQTARKHGSIQEKKRPCKNCMYGWRRRKRKMRRKGGRVALTKGDAHDSECRGKCWALA